MVNGIGRTVEREIHTQKLVVNGVDVTDSISEIAALDGLTASVAELNKLDGVTSSTAELNILTGVTATAAEINKLDNATVSTAELNKLTNAPFDATFVIGADVGDVVNVAIQLLDADGSDLATRAAVHFYLSDDAEGDTVVAAATSLAIGTDGVAIEYVSNSAGILISEADGDIDLNIGDASGAATYYLVLVLPNGLLKVSTVITFDA